MRRIFVNGICLAGLLCGLGCGGETAKDKNPNPSLGEINTQPLPKREGVKDSKK